MPAMPNVILISDDEIIFGGNPVMIQTEDLLIEASK